MAGSALTTHQTLALYEDYPAQNPLVIDPRLAARFRKERPQPVSLCFRQPEKIAHDASPIWDFESCRKPSLKHLYGS
jgi:hypothetical protein